VPDLFQGCSLTMWCRRQVRQRPSAAALATVVAAAWLWDVPKQPFSGLPGCVSCMPSSSFCMGMRSNRRSQQGFRSSACSRALDAGDIVEVRFEGQWVDATVEAEHEMGVHVNFLIDGYQYHLTAPVWRRLAHRRKVNSLKAGPRGKDLSSGTDGKAAGRAVNVGNEALPPRSPLSTKDFDNLPQDLRLNATITAVTFHVLFVLVEPPPGSASGPCEGKIMRRDVVIPGGSTGGALLDELIESKQSGEWVSFDQHFSVGDKLQVRVLQREKKTGQLTFSMKEAIDRRRVSNTQWFEAVVTGVSEYGVFVSFTLPADGQAREALVPIAAVSPDWIDDLGIHEDMFTVGERVRVRVVRVERERITCSMLPKQDVTAWKAVPQEKWFPANVTGIGPQYATVQIQRSQREQPVQGIISESDVWLQDRAGSVEDLLARSVQGQSVRVRVQNVSAHWGKLSCSMKPLPQHD